MNKNIIITIVGISIALIGLVFALTPLVGNDEVKRTCMTGEEYGEHTNFFRNECPENFEEFGYESSRDCVTREIALFDPVMCMD